MQDFVHQPYFGTLGQSVYKLYRDMDSGLGCRVIGLRVGGVGHVAVPALWIEALTPLDFVLLGLGLCFVREVC